MENLSRVFQKQKRKKTLEENEFLLLPFTSCRKEPWKLPDWASFNCYWNLYINVNIDPYLANLEQTLS